MPVRDTLSGGLVGNQKAAAPQRTVRVWIGSEAATAEINRSSKHETRGERGERRPVPGFPAYPPKRVLNVWPYVVAVPS
jgi:hypothetical protein